MVAVVHGFCVWGLDTPDSSSRAAICWVDSPSQRKDHTSERRNATRSRAVLFIIGTPCAEGQRKEFITRARWWQWVVKRGHFLVGGIDYGVLSLCVFDRHIVSVMLPPIFHIGVVMHNNA